MSLCSLTSILSNIPELLTLDNDKMSLERFKFESTKIKPDDLSYYQLGDLGKEEHMRSFKHQDAKILAIGQLKENDYAFLQRSKGEWIYAMVIEAPNEDRRIKFRLDSRGQTKSIPECQWAKYIRLLKHDTSYKPRHSAHRLSWEGSLEEDTYSKPPAERRENGNSTNQ